MKTTEETDKRLSLGCGSSRNLDLVTNLVSGFYWGASRSKRPELEASDIKFQLRNAKLRDKWLSPVVGFGTI